MRLGVVILGVAAILAGCASTGPGPSGPVRTWVVERKVDAFSDVASCRVIPRAVGINRVLNPYSPLFYPYVEKRGNEVRVGMFSGGTIQLPAGRIQLRIDGNEAWTIETSETPIDSEAYSAAALADQLKSGMGDDISPDLAESVDRSAQSTAQMMNQAMSPYTAATGDRANRIISQMRTGGTMIYRQIGANSAASTTGTIALGPDFQAALAACGI